MRVAQRYVGAVVAQLADCVGLGQLGVVVVQDAERAAGDGDADASDLAETVCRRQVDMRAVASVWPYMTTKRFPVPAAYSPNSFCSFFENFPPA